MRAPQIAILAGPNGAGKTTLAPVVLDQLLGIRESVNADVIAQGPSRFNPEGHALAAGKLMLKQLAWLAECRQSFAFETTLASRSFVPFIRSLCDSGYEFSLFYVWLITEGQRYDS